MERNIERIALYSLLYSWIVLINPSAIGECDDISKSLSIRKSLRIFKKSSQASGANIIPRKKGANESRSIILKDLDTK